MTAIVIQGRRMPLRLKPWAMDEMRLRLKSTSESDRHCCTLTKQSFKSAHIPPPSRWICSSLCPVLRGVKRHVWALAVGCALCNPPLSFLRTLLTMRALFLPNGSCPTPQSPYLVACFCSEQSSCFCSE